MTLLIIGFISLFLSPVLGPLGAGMAQKTLRKWITDEKWLECGINSFIKVSLPCIMAVVIGISATLFDNMYEQVLWDTIYSHGFLLNFLLLLLCGASSSFFISYILGVVLLPLFYIPELLRKVHAERVRTRHIKKCSREIAKANSHIQDDIDEYNRLKAKMPASMQRLRDYDRLVDILAGIDTQSPNAAFIKKSLAEQVEICTQKDHLKNQIDMLVRQYRDIGDSSAADALEGAINGKQ